MHQPQPPDDPKDMTLSQMTRRVQFIIRRIERDKGELSELSQRIIADLNLPR